MKYNKYVLKQLCCLIHLCNKVIKSKEILLKEFGQQVKNIRLSKKLTQVEVSTAMGRDQQSLQRVESGRVNPSLSYLLELAQALQVDPKELFDFDYESGDSGE